MFKKCSHTVKPLKRAYERKNAVCVAVTGGGVFTEYPFSVFVNCVVTV